MRVIGIGVLDKANRKHGDLKGPLGTWLQVAKQHVWGSLNDIRKTWAKTDEHAGKFIFNIKGNTYRLIATINFASGLVEVLHVLTHAEYDKEGWK
jgi:mRNA interferase HigB